MSGYVPEKGHQIEATVRGEVTTVGQSGYYVRGADAALAYVPSTATVERLPDPERWEPGDAARSALHCTFLRTADGKWLDPDGKIHGDWYPARPLTRLAPEPQQPEPDVVLAVPASDDPDAAAWAESFVQHVRRHPGIPTDEGTMIGWFANAMRAALDHKQNQPEQPVYRVGDPDPTPGVSPSDACEAVQDGWHCTWPSGHDHPQHVAGAFRIADPNYTVRAVWPVDGAS